MAGWPGQWHSKPVGGTDATGSDASLTNDNGLLFLTGAGPDAYLWFESSGHEHRTEIRR